MFASFLGRRVGREENRWMVARRTKTSPTAFEPIAQCKQERRTDTPGSTPALSELARRHVTGWRWNAPAVKTRRELPSSRPSQHGRAPMRYVGFRSYAAGILPFRSWATAVTSWAGAKGLASMMLLGTPLEAQSSALSPLI